VLDGKERTCPHCGALNGLERLVGSMWTHDECIRSLNGWWIRGPSPGSLLE
jgi:ribosomal protein L37AE/L43A